MIPEFRPSPERGVTTAVAAYRLGVSRCTVLRYIHAGLLPVTQYRRGPFHIPITAIAKLLRARRRTA
jgi:predicted site-specific integrase-resolvase